MKMPRYRYAGALTALMLLTPVAGRAHAAIVMDDNSTVISGQIDGQILADINKQLSKKKFNGIAATVQNGVITLKGTTDLFEYKQEVDQKAHRVKNVAAVRNQIEVGGKEVSDQALSQALAEKLQYDRIGYGNVFNTIKLGVQNGVVTLAGSARTPNG